MQLIRVLKGVAEQPSFLKSHVQIGKLSRDTEKYFSNHPTAF